jgi:hypothetical protein
MPSNHPELLNTMRALLPEVCGSYDGSAMLAPSATAYAEALSVTPSALYQRGSSYEDKLELVTGLKVVHKGVVLGNPDNYTDPQPATHLESLATTINNLPEDERLRLLARLATRQD